MLVRNLAVLRMRLIRTTSEIRWPSSSKPSKLNWHSRHSSSSKPSNSLPHSRRQLQALHDRHSPQCRRPRARCRPVPHCLRYNSMLHPRRSTPECLILASRHLPDRSRGMFRDRCQARQVRYQAKCLDKFLVKCLVHPAHMLHLRWRLPGVQPVARLLRPTPIPMDNRAGNL